MTAGSRASVLPSYVPGEFWDEMFEAPGQVRPHYAELARRLTTLSSADVQKRQRAADLSFQAQGITFSVNQDPSGPEQRIPIEPARPGGRQLDSPINDIYISPSTSVR